MKTMVLVAMMVAGCGVSSGPDVVEQPSSVDGGSSAPTTNGESACGTSGLRCCGTAPNTPNYLGTCNAGFDCVYHWGKNAYVCASCGQIGQPCCAQGQKCVSGAQCLTSGGEDIECVTQ